MSGTVILRALLLAHAPVTAIVGTKVFLGTVPQATVLPAIGIKEISRVEQKTVGLNEPTVLVTARIQVTVLTKAYPSQKALLQAAKLGSGSHTGMIAGVAVRSITREAVGPDMSDEDAKIYEQSRDFKVTYIETN